MSLEVLLRHELPSFKLEASFESAGRLTALFGPSGCGKTTIVNVIAGLLRPAEARVVCDGQILADTRNGIWLPAHRRQIGYVFQDARLLPHLSARQNLRYGQWFTPPRRRYAKEADIIDMLGLALLLDRRSHQLSGGEKQRVAIGRALLQSPRLLLMDEPLASLDEARKQEILPYIERLRDEAGIPIVYVSHAVQEVTRLATDVVLMTAGRVVESGPLQRIMPALSAVSGELAREAGAIVDTEVAAYDPQNDLTILSSGAGELRLAGQLGLPGTRLRLHVRAVDVTLALEKPRLLSALNVVEGVVDSVTPVDGSSVDVSLRSGNVSILARVTRYSANTLDIQPGTRVYAIIKAMSVRSPATLSATRH